MLSCRYSVSKDGQRNTAPGFKRDDVKDFPTLTRLTEDRRPLRNTNDQALSIWKLYLAGGDWARGGTEGNLSEKGGGRD